jgi:hypothetical protein
VAETAVVLVLLKPAAACEPSIQSCNILEQRSWFQQGNRNPWKAFAYCRVPGPAARIDPETQAKKR